MPIVVKGLSGLTQKSIDTTKRSVVIKTLLINVQFANALINLFETNKLLPRHRSKCQNSGNTFKYITTSYRMDVYASINDIKAELSRNCSKGPRLLFGSL